MEKPNPDLDRFVESFREGNVELPDGYRMDHGHHSGPFTTEREAEHCGKRIFVRTTYEITIDDKPLDAHVVVMNDGTVHYHGLPNYSFGSAIDMARHAIDAELKNPPEDQLAAGDRGSERKGGHHGHS